MANNSEDKDIRSVVRREYGRIARKDSSCCHESPCCGTSSEKDIAATLGYGRDELAILPEGANMGLSCGNPTAIASLESGEVVLDLGSGGGFDVFIAARNVGPAGKAIGVDMTPEMLAKARDGIKSFRETTGLDNVEFRLGEIGHLPLADSCVDVVISNCVINLSPDKSQVWREIARVLKPGGRVSVSDLALLKPLPETIRSSVEALVGCLAGAVLVEKARAMLQDAGFTAIKFEYKSDYIDEMINWAEPLYVKIASELPPGTKTSDFVTSINISARKPKNN